MVAAASGIDLSVTEIGRQVQQSTRIADEAVGQAHKTDDRITELSKAASRIGDVVRSDQRASPGRPTCWRSTHHRGGARRRRRPRLRGGGRRSRRWPARPPRRPTRSARRSPACSRRPDSVTAIKEIGGTIGRISEIAATIAAAVEQQGAATQEIARNVQEAAKGTTAGRHHHRRRQSGAGESGAAATQMRRRRSRSPTRATISRWRWEKFLATVRAASASRRYRGRRRRLRLPAEQDCAGRASRSPPAPAPGT